MTDKTDINSELIQAQITKLMAEVMKISAEAKWYPFVVLAAVITATATLTGLTITAFFKWF